MGKEQVSGNFQPGGREGLGIATATGTATVTATGEARVKFVQCTSLRRNGKNSPGLASREKPVLCCAVL